MNEVKAKEGHYLSDKNKTVFYKSVKGANVNADDYIEVEETEAEGIIKHNNIIREIDTLEKVDDCVYRAGLVAECMNIVPMTNKGAVSRTSLFPKWEEYIGKSFDKSDGIYLFSFSAVADGIWGTSIGGILGIMYTLSSNTYQIIALEEIALKQ